MTRYEELIARAIYEAAGGDDAPPWLEAAEPARKWCHLRAVAVIAAVSADLRMFADRNLTGDGADGARAVIARIVGR